MQVFGLGNQPMRILWPPLFPPRAPNLPSAYVMYIAVRAMGWVVQSEHLGIQHDGDGSIEMA